MLASRCRRTLTPRRVSPPLHVSPPRRVSPPLRMSPPCRVSPSHRVSPRMSSVFTRRLSSRVIVIQHCQLVVLGVWGFLWCRPLWPFVAGGVVTSLCRGRVVRCRRRRRPWGGCSPFPSTHASAGLVCYLTVVLGLQMRSVRWGVMMTGWPLTFPCAHVTYMAWALHSFAIVLALSSWGSKQG